VTEPHISAWRRAVCGDLTSAFDFGQQNTSVPSLPPVAAYVPPDNLRHHSVIPVPPSPGAMPAQESGVRPARALPYDLRADGVVSGGNLTVTFASRGPAGAVFHVTSAGSPQTFTAGPRTSLAGTWPLTAGQNVQVHGPNGFFRQFAGTGPDITAVPLAQNLNLRFTSQSRTTVQLTVADAYTGKSFPIAIRPHRTESILIPSLLSKGWYNITITSHDPAYLRRLAGHVETGRPSISDPALGTQ
jgi:phospholipase C